MNSNIPTPHINAPEGAFADTVLMPGDPLRSRFIAENFLENAELVNNVRGVHRHLAREARLRHGQRYGHALHRNLQL